MDLRTAEGHVYQGPSCSMAHAPIGAAWALKHLHAEQERNKGRGCSDVTTLNFLSSGLGLAPRAYPSLCGPTRQTATVAPCPKTDHQLTNTDVHHGDSNQSSPDAILQRCDSKQWAQSSFSTQLNNPLPPLTPQTHTSIKTRFPNWQ